MCSLSLSLFPSLVPFPSHCVSSERERVCVREDQLEGIQISATGFFPSVVVFSAEGTVLFHLSECASSVPLCVCVFGLYLGCTETFDSENAKQVARHAPHTSALLLFRPAPSRRRANARANDLLRP